MFYQHCWFFSRAFISWRCFSVRQQWDYHFLFPQCSSRANFFVLGPTAFRWRTLIFLPSHTGIFSLNMLSMYLFVNKLLRSNAGVSLLQHPYIYLVLIFEASATFIGQLSVLCLIALFGAATTAMVSTHSSPIFIKLWKKCKHRSFAIEQNTFLCQKEKKEREGIAMQGSFHEFCRSWMPANAKPYFSIVIRLWSMSSTQHFLFVLLAF